MDTEAAASSMSREELDQLCINTIRFLAVDAVEQANSGHPGAPLGMAPMAYVLWTQFMRHNPANPAWHNRDRFVLSAGHASMLQYALMHLSGYDLPLDEIKNFRQLGSKTPGHPENFVTPGVETTTGPLGQGFGNAVGMAVAEAWLAANFNKPGHKVVDHNTYAIASDGDLMEGVASEAASLAGFLKLGKLCVMYDDNSITIEGGTDLAFKEDVGKRFESYGWHVIGPIDGMDAVQVHRALMDAKHEDQRPTLIICKTIIGFGSPKANDASSHGAPLGAEAVQATKEKLGWPQEPTFHVPEEAAQHMRRTLKSGSAVEHEWQGNFELYRNDHPELAAEYECCMAGELPDGWDSELATMFDGQEKPVATRSASGKVINSITKKVRNMVGGSADLSPSNKSELSDYGHMAPGKFEGNNMHFGVREHAMGAMANGMALHGGVIPYTATFLQFADYMRPGMRLAALMNLPVKYIFTHDSIGLGEDGPTHQPVEHLLSLRAMPNMTVLRPADANETAQAWKLMMQMDGPAAIMLSRQNLTVFDREECATSRGTARGGYVMWASGSSPQLILIGTGSEMEIALQAGRKMAAQGVAVRVVSMPSWEIFDAQPKDYRETVLPPSVTARVSVEAGVTMGWERYIGPGGIAVGIDTFGKSAPAEDLYKHFGITVEAVIETAQKLLS